MKKLRFTDEQIIGFLKQVKAGPAVKELGRKHRFSDASFYKWRSRFSGMDVADVRGLWERDGENVKLKKRLAEARLRRVGQFRCLLQVIRTDQGPVTGNALVRWVYGNQGTQRQLWAGKPMQNAYI